MPAVRADRRRRRLPRRHRALLAILATTAVIAAAIVSALSPAARWIHVTIGGPHGTRVVTLAVPAQAVHQAAASNVAGHQGMRDETPPGAPAAMLNAAQHQQDALAATDQLPIVTPLAAPEQRGCRTELVQDYSTRRGVRPRLFVLHYTVSPNRPGWSDVQAVVSLFDTWAFQASSNYVIDNEGNCAYIVRESDKAWTQAAFNPDAISVEVINTGREGTYAGTAGLTKVALVISDALCRWQIPVQQGATSGGVVTRPGIVDHSSLGVAGGGHHDITPYPVGQVVAAAQRARARYGCSHEPVRKPVPRPALTPARTPGRRPACTVSRVQTALNRRGWRLAADGILGPRTAAALRRFQHAHRIQVTGRIGPGTCRALNLGTRP